MELSGVRSIIRLAVRPINPARPGGVRVQHGGDVVEPLIEFRNVSKSFGKNRVLKNVNLTIYENQITTIIGKSGTGKSVLIKHMVGLLHQDEGEIFMGGTSLESMKKSRRWNEYRRSFSYMFQGNALFDSMTVFENVALPLRYTSNLTEEDIKRKVMNRIEQAELNNVICKYPAELSGGMQKRVALARALVTDPKVVLFDEPTTGQDLVRRNIILGMIAHSKKSLGFTAILVSHDIPDIFFISDRIIIIWEGTVAFQGTYEEAIKLKHPIIEELLRSLEGFQDELTGLLSKQMFRSRYAMTFRYDQKDMKGAAVLFSVNFDQLVDNLGHATAVGLVKSLGEYVNMHLGFANGFSTRQRRGQILTIIPHFTVPEAKEVVERFAKVVREEVLESIERDTQHKLNAQECFEIEVSAGVAEVASNDDIDQIVRQAAGARKIIAVYRCNPES
jgi:phospholipid/cholesterol/gamma-HCH transport system ATP-binding protein